MLKTNIDAHVITKSQGLVTFLCCNFYSVELAIIKLSSKCK